MGKKKRKPINPTTPTTAPVAVAVAPQPAAPPEPPQSLRHFFTPEDWIAAAITFLIAGFAFLRFMSPEVTLEDSGELVTGAFNFGVPHPPGYPLWAFLGWIWRHFVPFGNPAYRICLMSVLTGALVVGVLTLLMTRSIEMLLRSVAWAREIEDSMKHWIAITIGATVALLFGFNRGVWLWACVPEMRVLNVFMFIITACTFFAWMMRPQRHGFLYATIFLYALGIANHQTIFVMVVPFMAGALAVGVLSVWDCRPVQMVVVMSALSTFWELLVAALFGWAAGAYVFAWLQTPGTNEVMAQKVSLLLIYGPPVSVQALIFPLTGAGILLLVWLGSEGWLSRKNALICLAVLLIGWSFYFYMPVSSSTNPPMNWGYAYTKQGFLHHITRGQYEKLNLRRVDDFQYSRRLIGRIADHRNSLHYRHGFLPALRRGWFQCQGWPGHLYHQHQRSAGQAERGRNSNGMGWPILWPAVRRLGRQRFGLQLLGGRQRRRTQFRQRQLVADRRPHGYSQRQRAGDHRHAQRRRYHLAFDSSKRRPGQ